MWDLAAVNRELLCLRLKVYMEAGGGVKVAVVFEAVGSWKLSEGSLQLCG